MVAVQAVSFRSSLARSMRTRHHRRRHHRRDPLVLLNARWRFLETGCRSRRRHSCLLQLHLQPVHRARSHPLLLQRSVLAATTTLREALFV